MLQNRTNRRFDERTWDNEAAEAIPSRHQTSGICCGIWYAQLGCMGLIELCDIKRMRLILLQIFFYFGSFFLGLKVSRKWLDYLLHTLGALRRVTSGIYGICFIWMSQPCFVSAFRSIIHRDLAVRKKKHAKWQTLEWLETSNKRISMKDRKRQSDYCQWLIFKKKVFLFWSFAMKDDVSLLWNLPPSKICLIYCLMKTFTSSLAS